MSSHREAPEISKDPTADSTDVYAFVTPSDPSTVTLIANYVPLQSPDGGPNFYEFDDKVGYFINIDNTGSGTPDISYQFQFHTVNTNPNTFLYNTGPITSPTATTWNRRQTYTLSRIDHNAATTTVLGSNLPMPPCNIGPSSTPDYVANLVTPSLNAAKNLTAGGHTVTAAFAGQRAEGFYVDLGSVFDLGNLRPFESLNAYGLMTNMPGVNSTDQVNVHSLALQVPITEVVAGGTTPANYMASNAVIGVWTSATRAAITTHKTASNGGGTASTGGQIQVSRLGNPLVNELLIALANKDQWNANVPAGDGGPLFLDRFQHPELAKLLPALYPMAFPKLKSFNGGAPGTETTANVRNDIVAILLTGIPPNVIMGFQNHLAQPGVFADELRLNVAIAPATAATQSNLGLIGNDPAGFPNGRRVFDDVATIELRAVAGATLPLTNGMTTGAGAFPSADGAAGLVNFGLTNGANADNMYEGDNDKDFTANGTEFFLTTFPFLGTPHAGYDAHTVNAVNGGSVNSY